VQGTSNKHLRHQQHDVGGLRITAERKAQQHSSHNDRVLSSAGDEALARRAQEEEMSRAIMSASSIRLSKKAKLTGKAFIKKKLGLS
jgi:hypothetical protein